MCVQGVLKAYFHAVFSDSLLALTGGRVKIHSDKPTSTLFK